MAYAGALTELAASGFDFWTPQRKLKTVCGCSIGALFGAMIVVGATAQEIEDQARSRPMRDLVDPDVKLLVSRFGLDSGDSLMLWIDNLLQAKTGRANLTLKESYDLTGVSLEVPATNLNLARTEYLSHVTAPDLRVCEAVTISMSLPPVFCSRSWRAPVGRAVGLSAAECGVERLVVGQQVRVDSTKVDPIDGAELSTPCKGVVESLTAEGRATIRVERACSLVDGGLLDNFPLGRYDPETTLGIRLLWKNAFSLGSITSYFSRVASVALTAAERLEYDALDPKLKSRTITIDTGAIETIQIELSLEGVEALIARGRLAVLRRRGASGGS